MTEDGKIQDVHFLELKQVNEEHITEEPTRPSIENCDMWAIENRFGVNTNQTELLLF